MEFTDPAPTMAPTPTTMTLTDEQQTAVDRFSAGENMFITGPGGTGKSMFIREIVRLAKESNKTIQVCAMTGCAAVLLECGAKTVHSWSGLGLASGPDIEEMAEKVADSYHKRGNWMMTNILVVDEVSMMSKKMFELLELTARLCRRRNIPKVFGGMQVVFCGDFYQLPPVGDRDDDDTAKFCFESDMFDNVFDTKIEFTKSFRQAGDLAYTKILNQIRVGRLTKSSVVMLETRIGARPPDDIDIEPTRIYPTRIKVENLNNRSLKNLPGENKIYKMIDHVIPFCDLTKEQMKMRIPASLNYDRELTYLKNSINCPKEIKLKLGAQVMCVVNIDMENATQPICNGSQGKIVDFNYVTGFPIVKFLHGFTREIGLHTWVSEQYPNITVKQLPIVPAWAMTTHKSQGTTLEIAEVDVGGDIFACGQTYVALSRVKSLDGLYLKSFDPAKIKINKKVKQFYEKIKGE